MKLPLSARLLECASYLSSGVRVADIGCDHGYLGIHLLKNCNAKSIIASDVNEAPLQSAMRNAQKYGVADKMSFFGYKSSFYRCATDVYSQIIHFKSPFFILFPFQD